MRLSQITGKNYSDIRTTQEADVPRGISGSDGVILEQQSLDNNRCDADTNTDADKHDEQSEIATGIELSNDIREIRSHAPELIELAMKWNGTIGLTGKIVNNRVNMSKKDFYKHSKNLTQKKLLADPLLYVMFRSDEQSEGSFWDFLGKFPKEEDESNE